MILKFGREKEEQSKIRKESSHSFFPNLKKEHTPHLHIKDTHFSSSLLPGIKKGENIEAFV